MGEPPPTSKKCRTMGLCPSGEAPIRTPNDPALLEIQNFAAHLEDDYAADQFKPFPVPLEVKETIQKLENMWIFCEADMGHLIPCLFVGAQMAGRGHNVTVVSTKGIEEKIRSKLDAGGMKFLGIDATHIEHTEIPGKKEIQPSFLQRWEAHRGLLAELAKTHKPDFMLVDFTSLSGIDVCIEQDIPYVINLPGPVEMAANILSADSMFMESIIRAAAGKHMAKTVRALSVRIKKS